MEYIIFDANNIKFTCGVNGPYAFGVIGPAGPFTPVWLVIV